MEAIPWHGEHERRESLVAATTDGGFRPVLVGLRDTEAAITPISRPTFGVGPLCLLFLTVLMSLLPPPRGVRALGFLFLGRQPAALGFLGAPLFGLRVPIGEAVLTVRKLMKDRVL